MLLIAYHSHHMFPLAVKYEDQFAKATVTRLHQVAKCDIYSSVHSRSIDALECTSGYWKQNMTSTVRFQAAFTECINARPKVAVIVEIGPHPALKGPVQEILRTLGNSNTVYVPTCIRGQQGYETLDFFIMFSSIGVFGNRNQGNYDVANAALNALAKYRQSSDRPRISVALGALSK